MKYYIVLSSRCSRNVHDVADIAESTAKLEKSKKGQSRISMYPRSLKAIIHKDSSPVTSSGVLTFWRPRPIIFLVRIFAISFVFQRILWLF